MNSSLNYRQLHESYMQNLSGTSVWENILIITLAPFLIYFVCLIKFFLSKLNWPFWQEQSLVFLMEFVIIVFFYILSLTLLSEYIPILVISLLFIYFSILKYHINFTHLKFYLNKPKKRDDHRAYFTYFRSIISLLTCICILAVDFHIFPRRFAKTETYGFGLMDSGVGFYIVANGIIIKQRDRDRKSMMKRTFFSSLPILLLGIIRYFCIVNLDYQNHVTEYGMHWNFFFTLAIVKLVATCLICIFPDTITLMSVTIAMAHQLVLFFGAEKWVLSDVHRSNFISANREGIVSLPGYISLYLSSVALGKHLQVFDSYSGKDEIINGLTTLLSSVATLIFTLLLNKAFEVSRRLANLTYILWMLTMSLYGVSIAIFAEFALRSTFVSHDNIEIFTPNIFLSINYNNLLFFLLSNILTGVINLMFHTFFAGPLFSIIILSLYKLCSCSIMYGLYLKKIKLKFW